VLRVHICRLGIGTNEADTHVSLGQQHDSKQGREGKAEDQRVEDLALFICCQTEAASRSRAKSLITAAGA
jgi:hypothetical protein